MRNQCIIHVFKSKVDDFNDISLLLDPCCHYEVIVRGDNSTVQDMPNLNIEIFTTGIFFNTLIVI